MKMKKQSNHFTKGNTERDVLQNVDTQIKMEHQKNKNHVTEAQKQISSQETVGVFSEQE
jgi:hypothetical protein